LGERGRQAAALRWFPPFWIAPKQSKRADFVESAKNEKKPAFGRFDLGLKAKQNFVFKPRNPNEKPAPSLGLPAFSPAKARLRLVFSAK
jgi:hypothetical protein